MNKNLSISAIIVSVLALGIVFFGGNESVQTVVREIKEVGAVSSPDFASRYFSFGGVRQWAGSSNNPVQASTTMCAFQSPAASSTLDFASLNLSSLSVSATVVTIAKATTAFATTTLIGNQMAVAANARVTILASTTEAQKIAAADVFAPNSWLVFGVQGTTSPLLLPVGKCQARFTEF